MLKAIREVGYAKSTKFLFYSMVEVVYHLVINHFLYLSFFRKLFLVILGAKIAKESIIMDVKFFNWHHAGLGSLKIGKDCFIGDDTLIDLYDKVTLQDQVTIAQRVTILTHINVGYKDHPLQKFFPKESRPVIFKKCTVIGAGSVILPGVIIGSESFVAAGSVVAKDVPPKTLVAGIPAKVVRKIY